MGCTHPFGVEVTARDEQGKPTAIICPACGATARADDPIWPLYVALALYGLLLLFIISMPFWIDVD